MVTGIFKEKSALSILSFLSIALFLLGRFVDSALLSDAIAYIALASIILISMVAYFFNRNAYFYIKENHIKGAYHCFGKIDCDISDIEFALPRTNILTIQLKNGKRHIILGVANSYLLCSVIRKNMPFETADAPDVLIDKLNWLKTQRKKNIAFLCCALAVMFVNIYLAVLLTGGRDFQQFTSMDWSIMAIIGIMELAIIVSVFCFANTLGKKKFLAEQMKYILQRTMVETTPLPPGNAKKVYVDDDCTGRIVIFGYPNDTSVYYSVQMLDTDFRLQNVYTSEVYENAGDLPDEIESLIDITDKVYF